ncbi:MAG: DUF1722 domain-containing protein [Candidatus Krumholzibacteriota bacterium]|nr:DUF1722 domain-containing protein [Candidatus Krumholzibacteriota bacterium]
MRIWDIDPGYLSRQSLLGEHRELHAIVSIIVNGKKGYSKHPETLRWNRYGWALRSRHGLLSSEMQLRGFREKTPVRTRSNKGIWPPVFIDEPFDQYLILMKKYQEAGGGRIELPRSAGMLWSHHKYSVMARNIDLYREIGRKVAAGNTSARHRILARELVLILRERPGQGGIRNALEHMWGYVSDIYDGDASGISRWSMKGLLGKIRRLAVSGNKKYLISSTALGELGAWIDQRGAGLKAPVLFKGEK